MASEKRVEGSDGHAAPIPENLLSDNARRVFSEPDGAKRIAALQDLWSADGTLFEDTSTAIGHEAISDSVGRLLDQLPPGTVFAPDGRAAGHHGVARLRWKATAADGTIGPVSGTDIAYVQNGKIERLYVILDDDA